MSSTGSLRREYPGSDDITSSQAALRSRLRSLAEQNVDSCRTIIIYRTGVRNQYLDVSSSRCSLACLIAAANGRSQIMFLASAPYSGVHDGLIEGGAL